MFKDLIYIIILVLLIICKPILVKKFLKNILKELKNVIEDSIHLHKDQVYILEDL